MSSQWAWTVLRMDRVGCLFLGHLLDIEGLLVTNVELRPYLSDHILNGNFFRRRTGTFPASARFELYLASTPDFALVCHCRLDDFGPADLLHQLRQGALFDQLRPDVFSKQSKLFDLIQIGEETGKKMETLHEPGQQIDKCLAFFQRAKPCLEADPEAIHGILDLWVRSRG